MFYVAGVLALLGAGGWGYVRYLDLHPSDGLQLTDEAKAYVRENGLRLSDVEMKAADTYLQQSVVEITGNIANAGAKRIEVVEVFCVFRDVYGQLVLRRRMPIVSERMGGLNAGEMKTFRLPFDDLPESWNRMMPQLVIAGVKFS